jgi:hypothetical protein
MFLNDQSGVGEAVVIIFAENDVVENADAETGFWEQRTKHLMLGHALMRL